MRSKTLLRAALCALALPACAPAEEARAGGPQARSGGLEVVDPPNPDYAADVPLGELEYGTLAEQVVRLRNREQRPLAIKKITPGCSPTLNSPKRVLVRVESYSASDPFLTLEVHFTVVFPFQIVPPKIDLGHWRSHSRLRVARAPCTPSTYLVTRYERHRADMSASTSRQTSSGGHPFSLAPLPYHDDALEPVISRQTIALHYGKHHRAYYEKLNELVAGTEFARLSLAEIVQRTHDQPAHARLFNNAGQALNHDFYWRSLSPRGGGFPERLKAHLDRDFGGYEAFVEAFTQATTEQFGSGWAWLVVDEGVLKITSTSNADTPVAHGLTPLLTIDVWEHAYYLDYQNRREEHTKAVIERLLDWDFAAANLGNV